MRYILTTESGNMMRFYVKRMAELYRALYGGTIQEFEMIGPMIPRGSPMGN